MTAHPPRRISILDDYGYYVDWYAIREEVLNQLKRVAEQSGCLHATGMNVWRISEKKLYCSRGRVPKFLSRWRLGKGKRLKVVRSTEPRKSPKVSLRANENRKRIHAANENEGKTRRRRKA